MSRKQKNLQHSGGAFIRLSQLEKAYDLIFAIDERARLTYVGRSFSRLMGRSKEALLGKKITGLLTGRKRQKLAEAISTAGGGAGEKDVRLDFGDESFSFNIVSAGERSSHLAFLGKRSISAEEELRVIRWAQVVESIEESVCLTDLDHTILYVNPAMTRLLGFTKEELEGKKAPAFFENIPGNPRDLAKIVAREARGGRWQRDIFARRSDGTIFPISLIIDPVCDKEGRTIGYVGLSRDITEQRRLQRQLVQAEKMVAVGQLASGLAHEFNNLIAIISGRAQFAISKETSAEKDKAIEVALKMCERAQSVTSNLRSFARRVDAGKELSDIREVLEQILTIVARDMESDNIKIVRRYGKVPKVLLDRNQIQQVFLNILINAHHSMPAGGTQTIRIAKEGKFVQIGFEDTGIGIPDDIIGHIFEPFVTTKGAIGKGALPGCGLGLSVSYGIIKQHDGEISVKSTVGKGSTFTIKLPIAVRKRSTRGQRSSKHSVSRARKKR